MLVLAKGDNSFTNGTQNGPRHDMFHSIKTHNINVQNFRNSCWFPMNDWKSSYPWSTRKWDGLIKLLFIEVHRCWIVYTCFIKFKYSVLQNKKIRIKYFVRLETWVEFCLNQYFYSKNIFPVLEVYFFKA